MTKFCPYRWVANRHNGIHDHHALREDGSRAACPVAGCRAEWEETQPPYCSGCRTFTHSSPHPICPVCRGYTLAEGEACKRCSGSEPLEAPVESTSSDRLFPER